MNLADLTVNVEVKLTDSHRWKIMYVSPEVLLQLNWMAPEKREDGHIYVASSNLPPDVKIDAVHYDHCRDAFVFRLWHESFELVPPACCIPEFHATFTAERIDLTPATPVAEEIKSQKRGYEFL